MIRISLSALCAIVLTVAGLVAAGEARSQAAAGNVYTIANVTVEANAGDAVEAKQLALSNAQMKAFEMLLRRLTDFRLHARLPRVEAAQVERVVTNLDVRDEGFSGTVYRATLDIGFSDRAVKSLLNQFGLPYSEERAPPVLIVPVFVEAGAARTADRNPWRTALTQQDLRNGLVPLSVAPTRSDLTAAMAGTYFANPESAIEALRAQHKTQHIVLAIAERDAGPGSLILRLAGEDSLGLFTLERRLRLKDGSIEDVADQAAGITYHTLQERWKLTRPTSGLAAAGGGAPSAVELIAEFSGLREWQTIRGKLQRLPGMQNFEVRSVNPRAAQISFDYPGGAQQLAQIAAGQGLDVEQAGGAWVVRSR